MVATRQRRSFSRIPILVIENKRAIGCKEGSNAPSLGDSWHRRMCILQEIAVPELEVFVQIIWSKDIKIGKTLFLANFLHNLHHVFIGQFVFLAHLLRIMFCRRSPNQGVLELLQKSLMYP